MVSGSGACFLLCYFVYISSFLFISLPAFSHHLVHRTGAVQFTNQPTHTHTHTQHSKTALKHMVDALPLLQAATAAQHHHDDNDSTISGSKGGSKGCFEFIGDNEQRTPPSSPGTISPVSSSSFPSSPSLLASPLSVVMGRTQVCFCSVYDKCHTQ
jgi:hypothetical protein